jgi:hypothetical protein
MPGCEGEFDDIMADEAAASSDQDPMSLVDHPRRTWVLTWTTCWDRR